MTTITEALRRLEIQQEKIEEEKKTLSDKIVHTRTAVGGLTYLLRETQEQDQEARARHEPLRQEVISGSELYIGDKVRVLNP